MRDSGDEEFKQSLLGSGTARHPDVSFKACFGWTWRAPGVWLIFLSLCALIGSYIARHSSKSSIYSAAGLVEGSAAYMAAKGDWAGVGDSWATGSPLPTTNRTMLSNGTHPYQRTILLVSMDGVRADYLTRKNMPHLFDLGANGIRADYLESVFPTLTFPNHWSILTGLYAESHGIVGNDFYDPSTKQSFSYVDPRKSWSPHWWKGEPVWAKAEQQGVKTVFPMTGGLLPAIYMSAGDIDVARATRNGRRHAAKSLVKSPVSVDAYEDMVHWSHKTNMIAQWLDLPLESRPRFIAAYLPEVDRDAHRTGAESAAIYERLIDVDGFVASIEALLKDRNLRDIVDVFFVSDHGMTDTANTRLIFLDEILGEHYEEIKHKDVWPMASLRFSHSADADVPRSLLEKAAKESRGAFSAYTADTMPSRWHYAPSVCDRIAPLVLVPTVGWSITSYEELRTMNGSYHPLGNHGYDPHEPDMHAIFVADGPFARHLRSRAAGAEGIIPAFRNVELHNLFAKILEISPAKNNGTANFWERLETTAFLC